MILITGDSWACGEWNGQGGRRIDIGHAGLAQYIREHGHRVINLGKGGGSNLESASRIEDFLAEENKFIKEVTCVFVFQTEWTRDAVNHWNLREFQQVRYNYTQLKNQLIGRFYYKLSAIATHHKIKIYVIGGCSDTLWVDNINKEYPGVVIACQSWVNLMLNNQHRIDQPVLARFGREIELLIQYAKSKINHESLTCLLNDISLSESRNTHWKQLCDQKLLCNDLTHPNRIAHKILFDFLIKCIPELSKL